MSAADEGSSPASGNQQLSASCGPLEPGDSSGCWSDTMIPGELLPLVYVTWEEETVQMYVPSWDLQRKQLAAASHMASQGQTADTADTRRAAEAHALRKVCADAFSNGVYAAAEDVYAAAPCLHASMLYSHALKLSPEGASTWLLQNLSAKQVDDVCVAANVKKYAAGYPGLLEMHNELTCQAALDMQRWGKSKLAQLAPVARRSRHSRLVQQACAEAKQKHARTQEHIEILSAAAANLQNWMLSFVARDSHPTVTACWLKVAFFPVTGSALFGVSGFDAAWAAVTDYYHIASRDEVCTADKAWGLNAIRASADRCRVMIGEMMKAALYLDQLLFSLQDATGAPQRPTSHSVQRTSNKTAAADSNCTAAVTTGGRGFEAHADAETLLPDEQAEAAGAAAASRKKRAANKKRKASKRESVPECHGGKASAPSLPGGLFSAGASALALVVKQHCMSAKRQQIHSSKTQVFSNLQACACSHNKVHAVADLFKKTAACK